MVVKISCNPAGWGFHAIVLKRVKTENESKRKVKGKSWTDVTLVTHVTRHRSVTDRYILLWLINCALLNDVDTLQSRTGGYNLKAGRNFWVQKSWFRTKIMIEDVSFWTEIMMGNRHEAKIP